MTDASKSYIVMGAGNRLPSTLEADVAAAGGHIERTIPKIRVAVGTSDVGGFDVALSNVRGLSGVAEDVMVPWRDPNQQRFTEQLEASESSVSAMAFGDLEQFRAIQWVPDAISAPAAWNAGHRGDSAQVAILDGGIPSMHVDIAPNLDVASSASFVPGQSFNADVGSFWHGTHVAGIVGARGNGIGTVGIAPAATLIGVKVLHNGSGAFSWIIAGIVYAATPKSEGGAGADILNMSLGAGFERQGRDAAQLANAISRATMYARQQGAVVVAAAGNSAANLDQTSNLVFFPGQAAGVINVSSAAPLGWAVPNNPFSFDRPASYTNYGQSAINFAAPGGDSALPGNALCSKPLNPSGAIVVPCWVLDMVIAPCRGVASVRSYCFASGTSMAAPAAAGVVALIIGKFGKIWPAQVEAKLRSSADDLGKPGRDDFYGLGRVNAWRAVQ